MLEKVETERMIPLCAREDLPSALSRKACLLGEGPQAIRLPFLPCISHLKPLHLSPFQPSTIQTSILLPLGGLYFVHRHTETAAVILPATQQLVSQGNKYLLGWFCFEDVWSLPNFEAGGRRMRAFYKEKQHPLIRHTPPLSSPSQPLLWVQPWGLAVIKPALPQALPTGVGSGLPYI